jgi:hypothetical protein
MWLSVVVILGRTQLTADTFGDSFYGATMGITAIERVSFRCRLGAS